MYLFLSGIIIGLSVAMPVGPSGILCIQRSLQYGWFSGFCVGLGAAIGDALFCSIAGLGNQIFCAFLYEYAWLINRIGGIILILFGLRNMVKITHITATSQAPYNALYTIFHSLVFTIINPLTVLFFISIFPAMGIQICTNSALAIVAVGTFIGTTAWFSLLAVVTSYLKTKLSDRYIRGINGISGLLITLFGLLLFFKGS